MTLVGIQFVLIELIVFTGLLWPQEWSLRGIGIVGGVVGLWALQVMGLRQVKVFPEVPGQGKLIVLGPYRWIRHPMYTSVLLVTLGSPLSYRMLLWVGISFNLIGQTPVRKGPLMERFPEKEASRGQAKRLIPFVG